MTPREAAPLPFDEAGAGSPVVLLHSGLADRTQWTELLEPLAAAGHRAVALDLPGFGEAPPRREMAPWRDVLATLDALGIDRAALVGNSFGGAVALSAAAIAPERVGALVLVSAPAPGLDEPSPELAAAWEAEEAAIELGDLEGAVRANVDHWLLPDASPALRERIAAAVRRSLALQTATDDPVEVEDPAEAPGALERLDVPALVLAGEYDMPDFRDGVEAIAARLPRARRTIVAGARHLAPLEQPDAFRELLLGFLGP